ncbi:MAG: hypothetical protein LBH65_01085 [Desulfovibrio sp.]|jgi:hypothetical protein|nr:hypothetical protein [Desulfovibrio sp.]
MTVLLKHPKIRLWLGVVFFILLGCLLRKLMPRPYVWVFAFLSWGVALGFLTAAVRSEAAKSVGLVCATVLLALFLVEGWLSLDAPGDTPHGSLMDVDSVEQARRDRSDPELRSFTESVDEDDPILGRRFKAGAVRLLSRGFMQGKEVYNVVYSTLESGWRVTPQNPDASVAVVFFGCSYTFGMGLEDEEAFPFRVGQALGPEYQVFNFAFPGYGAHQMLAQIENGFLDPLAARYDCIIPFFLTIEDHKMRSAGQDWARKGPRYVLENGRLEHRGKVSDISRYTLGPVKRFFRNCLIYRRFDDLENPALEEYGELHVAILARSAQLLAERYRTRLTVLLWPEAGFGPGLKRAGVRFVDLNALMPDWDEHKERYTIQNDEHPNAATARLLSDFLVDSIKRTADETPCLTR